VKGIKKGFTQWPKRKGYFAHRSASPLQGTEGLSDEDNEGRDRLIKGRLIHVFSGNR
jgi:hypothetical protein